MASLKCLGRRCISVRLRQQLWSARKQSVRNHSYDPDGKTTVTILNQEVTQGFMIDSYSQLGFRLNNGMFVIGPMAIFPRSVLSWNVEGVEDINEESLSLFSHLEPKIDILVLGFGDPGSKLNKDVYKYLLKHRISLEALPTEKACSTFNFLNSESRCVAGAFIPPFSIRATEDDIAQTKIHHRKVWELEH